MPRERTEVNKQEIIKRYKEGESLRDIAEDSQASYSTLYRRVEEWDVEREKHVRKIDLPVDEIIELYQGGKNCSEISDIYDCSTTPIMNRLRENGIELHGPEAVHIDEKELEKASNKFNTIKELTEEFNCTYGTIKRKLEKYNIEEPEYHHRKATLADINGYQSMQCGVVGKGVLVHRLLAVSEYGIEEVKDKVVHHKNGIKWDNRPDNIEVMNRAEHTKLHRDMRSE